MGLGRFVRSIISIFFYFKKKKKMKINLECDTPLNEILHTIVLSIFPVIIAFASNWAIILDSLIIISTQLVEYFFNRNVEKNFKIISLNKLENEEIGSILFSFVSIFLSKLIQKFKIFKNNYHSFEE